VRRWLPEFALADAPLGERLTPRDLVTHRSGMPRHDLVWYGATFERAAMVQRLRHLPMNHDLRTDFQYNNLMFLTAGHLAERVGGATWEQLVGKRILAPLGMTRTNLSVGAMQQDGNHALPYRKDDGAVGPIPFRDITAIGPAGSINSSVREMAKWVALQLQGGTTGERRLLSATMAADLHVVRMPAGDPPGAGDGDVLDIGYALGWFVDVYRGHRRVHHGGNIDGFSALVAMLPEAGYGFVVLCNLDATPLPDLVVRTLADRALGLEAHDPRAALRAKLQLAERAGKTAKQSAKALRHADTQPSRPLEEYVGRYTHPGYGECRIDRTASGLRVDLHGLVLRARALAPRRLRRRRGQGRTRARRHAAAVPARLRRRSGRAAHRARAERRAAAVQRPRYCSAFSIAARSSRRRARPSTDRSRAPRRPCRRGTCRSSSSAAAGGLAECGVDGLCRSPGLGLALANSGNFTPSTCSSRTADLLGRAGLLVAELVAREAEHGEAAADSSSCSFCRPVYCGV
jgi:CubicO group peptidase (beta-lactamase class C family)